MYLITFTLLLLITHRIKAIELGTDNNLTTFLPYTLKTNKGEGVEDGSLNKIEYKTLEKHSLGLYEEQNEMVKPPGINSWKRLTTFLPTGPTLNKHQDVTYLCKTPSIHDPHLQYSTSLLGSFNFPLAQTVIVLIQFAIISYILLASVTLFHRLLFLSPPTVNSLSEGLSDYFYKRDL